MELIEQHHRKCQLERMKSLPVQSEHQDSKLEVENMILKAKLDQLQKETIQLQAQIRAENLMRDKLEQRRKELDLKVLEENRAMQDHINLQGKIIKNDTLIKKAEEEIVTHEKTKLEQEKKARLTLLSQGKSSVSTPNPVKLTRRVSTLTKNGSLKRISKLDCPKVE